jgi:hypothetical protein
MKGVLHQLHSALVGICATPPPYDIHDFLITDARVADTLTPKHASKANRERLLVQADTQVPRMSLYIDD